MLFGQTQARDGPILSFLQHDFFGDGCGGGNLRSLTSLTSAPHCSLLFWIDELIDLAIEAITLGFPTRQYFVSSYSICISGNGTAGDRWNYILSAFVAADLI